MPLLINLNSFILKIVRCIALGLFGLMILLAISSCGTKKPESAGNSEAFKPVFDTVKVFFGTNRVEKGLHYLDSSMSRINNPNIDDKFRTYRFHYVYWRRVKGDNKNALLYADSMLMMAKKSIPQKQYVVNYVEANLAIGDAYFSLQQYNNAYQHYFEAFKVGKKNINNGALSDYSYRVGMILYKMDHYKAAAGYFKESYRLYVPTGDKFADFYRNQELIDNIGLSFKHNNEPDSAIFYFNKDLNYIDQNTPVFKNRANMIEMAKGVVYKNKAEILILEKNYGEAIDLLKKSIAINLKKGNDNSDAELAEIKLSQLYLDNNEIDNNLLSLLKNLKFQLDSVKNTNAEADWNRLMSRYYENQKEFLKALKYLQVYNTLKDSNVNKLNLLKESAVNEQLTNFEKQYQIDNLRDHNKIQQVYLCVAVMCALMGLFIIFLIFRNWKNSKHDVQIVNALNKQVNIQKENLEKTLEELKSNSLEKDRILRTVAHDLRNPIGGIASLTLAMADDGYTDEQKELINLIGETSNNSLELINEILEVTGNGSAQLNKELVEINSLTSRCVELLRFKAAEKNQEIKLDLLETPEELLISREKIWRVIGNLISNAIKFSPVNGIIYVKISRYKNAVKITVKDAGIGIPENLKDKIFNTFTEAKRPGTAGEKSFGLGLSISKQIIENHDGKIWFENNNSKGITFNVSLPKQVQKESPVSKN
ncbi:MAG: hypothetical protein JWP44_798 [Mucilaginibacter sp.]|nr:hypothetical protein [Mucilaginibacter sp.]